MSGFEIAFWILFVPFAFCILKSVEHITSRATGIEWRGHVAMAWAWMLMAVAFMIPGLTCALLVPR